MAGVTVVTGASGHAGANLVRALINRGRSVRAVVHNDARALEGLDLDRVAADVTDVTSLRRAFEGADVVYHLAAQISLGMDNREGLRRINVIGPANVVAACLDCRVRRLVHFSSIHALQQEPLHDPIDESRPYVCAADCAPYDLSKAAGEQEVLKGMERGLDAVIIRPTAITGPYDYRPSHFGQALLFLAKGKMPALVPGGFDWVDSRDVAEGAIRAEECAKSGAKYLLSGHWLSLADVAGMVAEDASVPCPKLMLPLWMAYIGLPFCAVQAKLSGERQLYTRMSLNAVQSNRNISHEAAARDLGYSPRAFRETVADTLAWFRKEGMIPAISKRGSSETACASGEKGP